MDASSLAVLHRLAALGSRSLLQYVSESCPWTTAETQDEFKQILANAEEERDAVGKLLRFLQKKHVSPKILGSYPAHYTMMNFITIDFLLPRLIAEDEKQIAAIEKNLVLATDDEAHTLIQSYLEMKRRHLQTLRASLLVTARAAS